jgi:hypothetical protein
MAPTAQQGKTAAKMVAAIPAVVLVHPAHTRAAVLAVMAAMAAHVAPTHFRQEAMLQTEQPAKTAAALVMVLVALRV